MRANEPDIAIKISKIAFCYDRRLFAGGSMINRETFIFPRIAHALRNPLTIPLFGEKLSQDIIAGITIGIITIPLSMALAAHSQWPRRSTGFIPPSLRVSSLR